MIACECGVRYQSFDFFLHKANDALTDFSQDSELLTLILVGLVRGEIVRWKSIFS